MNNISKVLMVIAAAGVLSSCTKLEEVLVDEVINITPTSQFSEDVVWGDSDAVDHYVYDFYAIMRNMCETYNSNAAAYTDAYADLLKSGSWNQYGQGYNTTVLQENSFNDQSAGAFECWSTNYTYIKRANEFLKKAENYVDTFGEDFISSRCAEVRMCRAYSYYQLIRVYGGVVLRTQLDGPDENDKARSTEAECWEFVKSDLEYAAAHLPESWTSSYTGRYTKAAAWGMLSRTALYAEDWQTAVNAADSCAAHGGQLAATYAEAISDATNAENLIAVRFITSTLTHRADLFFRPKADGVHHNNKTVYAELTPTSELADEFEMADGSAFSWKDNTNPYVGREQRFYDQIIYDGEQWEGREVQTYVAKKIHRKFYKGYGTASEQLVSEDDTTTTDATDVKQEFECSGTTTSTPTGYYFRKYITENDNTWETGGSSHFGTFLRYSEVLLNKAEAYAQLGNLNKANEALNEVRTRAGLPGRSDKDKETFMTHLRHERVVELAGEGLRYWDLRRWRIATEVIHGVPMHGVDITRQANQIVDATTNNVISEEELPAKYEQVSVDADRVRYFFERYYKFSIPLSERNNNNAISNEDNNEGW